MGAITSRLPDAMVSSPSEVANQILRESPYPAIRRLKCSFDNGILTIGGEVSRYHLKQLAQTAVQCVDGVEQICNLIEVSA
jgi:hypothetical protein